MNRIPFRLCIAVALGFLLGMGASGVSLAAAQVTPIYQFQLAYPGMTAAPANPGGDITPPESSGPAVGALSAPDGTDFGSVTQGAFVTRQFSFSNTGGSPATGVYADLTATAGLSLVSNTCGTAGAPVAVLPQQTCSFSVQLGGANAANLLSAGVWVNGVFTGAPASFALSGSVGAFNVNSYYLATQNTTVVSTAPLSFFLISVGQVSSKTIYLRNNGTAGSLAVGGFLSGDVAQFSIVLIRKLGPTGILVTCSFGGVVAADLKSVSPCWANDATVTSTFKNVAIVVRYNPISPGAHSVTFTPTTDNGSVLPAPLTITGTAM